MKKMAVIGTLSVLVLGMMIGCSKQSQVSSNLITAGKLFSNRPVDQKRFIAVLRLHSPALLTNATRVNGKTVIDQELKSQILNEQARVEHELATLDANIKVLYRYHYVLNALAVVVPTELEEKLKQMTGVSVVERAGSFGRPIVKKEALKLSEHGSEKNNKSFGNQTSSAFIGALKAHELGFTGKGTRIGVIDTGIDYTHAMFGGPGTKEAYQSVDPAKATDLFPSAKVVGGIDLVGTEYNGASSDDAHQIPVPDANPLDEGEHGSHVAGTIAGVGDGEETYTGVAPDASLYAIKVFGAEGSTGDAVVIAGLEYAADPNQDFNLDDQLDVVNLSLGSSYGKPHLLYSEAVKNLVQGGTLVVASAGNSGHSPFIVGSPSTTNEALSVAASIDNMDHNWKFDAVMFSTSANPKLVVDRVEAGFTTPIADLQQMKGDVVYVGNLAADLSDADSAKLMGKVALIDRGEVSFVEKFTRAQKYGAIAAVVANNSPGRAFNMGGTGKIDIPGVMVSFEVGNLIKDELKKGVVTVDLKSGEKVERPELIDTLTDFTSQGPRSEDGGFKPEIAAPGNDIVSAAMGEGRLGRKMSGTSMASPHMAGAMALIKQAFPTLSALELKALAMNNTKSLKDDKGHTYLLSLQGAGRVDLEKALKAQYLVSPAALSLGVIQVGNKKAVAKRVTVKNMAQTKEKFSFEFRPDTGLSLLQPPEAFELEAGASKQVLLLFELDGSLLGESALEGKELDAIVLVKSARGQSLALPIMAMEMGVSSLSVQNFDIFATGPHDAAGSVARLTLKNNSNHTGPAYIFQALGHDAPKVVSPEERLFRSTSCDLRSVGYRVFTKGDEDVLQIAIKLYTPVTRWQGCEISVLIDSDHDGVAEQEIGGILSQNLPGLEGVEYTTVLLDAKKARQIRTEFEAATVRGEEAKEDYSQAVLALGPMKAFNFSGVAILEMNTTALSKDEKGEIAVKVAVSHEDRSSVEADDFLQNDKKFFEINLDPKAMQFGDLPETVELKANEQKEIFFNVGPQLERPLVFFPYNRWSLVNTISDDQMEVPAPNFLYRD